MIVVLLGVAMVLADSGSVPIKTVPPLIGDPAPPPAGEGLATAEPMPMPTGTGEEMFHLPPWVGNVLLGLCSAAVACFVGALIWLVLRERLSERKPVVEPASPEELRREAQERIRAAVDVGLADLDVADQDPRRAVIACWARLEAAAAAAGTERDPGDSSSEFVQRLLAEHAVTAPVLAGLAAVYRDARFATHAVDETMRDQARAALRQLRDEFVNEIPAGGS